MTTRISIATALALATGLLHAVGQDTSKSPSANEPSANEPSADQVEFFETKVRPILVDHCYECHSVEAEELEANLLLDSKWGWESGGDSGPAIIPGDLDGSLLIDAVRYEEDVVSGMPPRSKLPAKKIKILEQWVAMGATDPRPKRTLDQARAPKNTFDLDQRFREHWSWKPIRESDPPSVEESDWPRSEIDRFILASIEGAKLRPAEPASRRRWLRRVSFDLTGLPPSAQEIAEYLDDTSDTAEERVVDRLLDSTQYGEKWARHWLDLVRYAETYGHEFDYPIRGATEYRDYVIRAINADVPYNQFVREHIAGDLLEAPRRHPKTGFNESIIATGFWYLHEATHAPTDVLGNEADIIDNQIDVFGKTFLGLTVACARCHDHKFDAISTADYYALSAYIQSSCRQVVDLDPGAKRSSAGSEIKKILRETTDQLAETARNLESSPELIPGLFKKTAPLDAARPQKENEAGETFADFHEGKLPSGWSTTGHAFQFIGDELAIRPDGSIPRAHSADSGANGNHQVGILRSPTFEITTKQIHLLVRASENMTAQVIIDNYQMAPFNGLLFKGTFLNGKSTNTNGLFKWKSLAGDLKKYIGHKAYLEFIDTGEGSIAIDEIIFSDGPPPPLKRTREIDQSVAGERFSQAIQDLSSGRSNEWFTLQINRNRMALRDLDSIADDKLAESQRIDQSIGSPRYAVAMSQGTPESAHVYIRGSHTNLGEEVPARFLEALGGRPGSRLALAEEVVGHSNPLTSRVIVNRIWHHLFGRGIVPTVDDFGPQGQPPSHPELLDWLANDLMNHGWSLKHTIRSIVLSATYRQDSVRHQSLDKNHVASADPTNSLLHHMRVRRLPAESIRDAIFMVSGRLNSKSYGPSVATHRTKFMSGRGARPSGPLDGDGRRSIYLAVYRNFLDPFMQTFDRPSPFGPQGRRSQSNVPAQALTLLNDPMVIDQCSYWAKQIVDSSSDDRAKMIAQMIERAHGVEATSQQINAMASFLDRQTEVYGKLDERAWADLAQAIFNMKAFYFLQ